MSLFDDAFAAADAAAFATMGGKTAVLWNVSPASGREVEVIDMPVAREASYRSGGRVRGATTEFEIRVSAWREAVADVRWKLRFDGEDFLILSTALQGDTVTLVCGSRDEAVADEPETY